MKYILKLQLTLINRELVDFGIKPILGYLISVFAFIFFSHLFFQKVLYPEYFYIFFSLSILLYLNEKRRNDFLKLGDDYGYFISKSQEIESAYMFESKIKNYLLDRADGKQDWILFLEKNTS